jgi:hypothetical protein
MRKQPVLYSHLLDNYRMLLPGNLDLSLAHDATESNTFSKRLSLMSANLKATTLGHRDDSDLSCRRDNMCKIC